MSNSQPNHHDAELILKLYDLRRESVMREARNWMATFNPQSIDEVMKVMSRLRHQRKMPTSARFVATGRWWPPSSFTAR